MGNKLIAYAIIVCSFVFYFYWSQNKIEHLNKDISEYRISVEAQEQTIEKLISSVEEQNQLYDELQSRMIDAERYNDELSSLLRKHNLTMLSLKKPSLIEKRINDATKQIFEDITNLTAN